VQATLSEIYVDSTGTSAKIVWSKSAVVSSDAATQATLATSPHTAGQDVTNLLPANLLVAKTYLIFSEVSYLYKPTIGYVMAPSGVTLKDVAFTRPRQAYCVIYNNVPADPCPST
jgi:hypothetical protein